MLDVNNVLPTPYNDRKMKIFSGFNDVDVDEKRKTKDERRKTKDVDRKRTEERRKLIQNNVLVPKTNNMRKEEGATVGVCRPFCSLPSLSGQSHQAGPAAFFHGRIQNSGKLPLTTENVLLTKRT
jgi:hypothetical protein